MNPSTDALKIKAKNERGFKFLLPGKWICNRNTPVGEPADFYELLPHGGHRYFESTDILAILKETKP